MGQKTPVSGLTLATNLYQRGLAMPEWQNYIIETDFGFNKIQHLRKIMNQGKSEEVWDLKVNVPFIGSTSISNKVSGTSTISGTNLVVTLTQSDTRFRKDDQVMDNNFVKGRVVSFTDTTLTLEPISVTSWNASTHFTNGMNIADLGNVSANGRTAGLTSLTVTPDSDYAVLRKTRDSYDQDMLDRIKSFVTVTKNGKYWYAAQQPYMLKRLARVIEYTAVFDDRILNKASSSGALNTTGGIRWSAVNNGGTYMPLANEITRADLNEFMLQFMQNFPDAQKKIILYCGRRALFAVQEFLKDNVVTAGTNNVFGGAKVQGYDLYMYKIAGLEVALEYYPLFDDPLFANNISTITGAPRMSSTIMALDITPADSTDGTVAPAIKQYSFGGFGNKMAYKYIPGMLDSGFGDKEIMVGGSDFSMAVTDLDISAWHAETVGGQYVIPQKAGWIELMS